MQMLNGDTDTIWRQLAPVLDEAMAGLRPRERDALVLRFFERQPLRAVGTALGISEEAARKRVDRAVATLRQFLLRRGVAVPAGVLATILGAQGVSAAPVGLATALSGASMAGAASSASGPLLLVLRTLAMTKLQATTVGLLFLAGVATPLLTGSSDPLSTDNDYTAQTEPQSAAALSPGDTHTAPSEQAAGAPLQGSAALARLEAWLLKTDQADPWGFRNDELRAMIWSLARVDYPLGWRLAERLRSRKLRNQFQQGMVDYWSQWNLPAALTAAETLGGRARQDAMDQVLLNWAEKDPAAALAWTRQSLTGTAPGLSDGLGHRGDGPD